MANSALNAINTMGSTATPEQLDVIARTILGEARPNDPQGAAAVAWVIRNRAESGKFPSDPAKVAKQGNGKYHQFSAWNDTSREGNSLPYQSANSPAYQMAYIVAQQVFSGQTPDPTGGATYYHTPAVHPSWDKNMTQTAALGGHVFYSPGGQGGGNSGSGVRDIQQQLAGRGFSPGAIDGVKGPNTNAAIRAFQQANGLTVDGIVGPQTRAALSAGGGMPVPMQAGGPTPSFGGQGSPPPIPQQRPQFAPQAVTQAQAPIPQSYPAAPAGAPQIAPVPYPRPIAPGTPPAIAPASSGIAPAQLRLASGKLISPGTYASNDGNHSVKVTDDGKGNAVVTRMTNPGEISGVIDPMRTMKTDTLAGGVIRKIAPALVGQAVQSGKDAMGSAGNFLGTEAQKAGDFVSRAANNFPPYRAASQAISGIPGAIQSAVMSNYVMPAVKARVADATSAFADKASGVGGTLSRVPAVNAIENAIGGGWNSAANALGGMFHPTPPPALNPWAPMAAAGPMGHTYSPYAPYMPTGGPGTFAPGSMPRAVVPQRQVVAPVPQRRPVSFFSVSSPPPIVQQRVAISAPQQSNGGNNRAQQAQNDLRNSGMVNSFGMVV